MIKNRFIYFVTILVVITFSIFFVLVSGCGSKLTEPVDVYAPANLELEKTTNTTIVLSWTYTNSTTDSIKFLISKKSGESKWNDNYGSVTQKSFVDNINTNDSLVYVYKVRAYNDSTNEYSSYSNSVAYFSDNCRPDSLKIEHTAAAQIKLAWIDNSFGEEGFAVDKKIGDNAWHNNYFKTTANVTSFTDSTTLFQKFQYRISAFWGNDYSKSTSATITPTLFAPTDLELQNLDNTNIRLNWTDNNNTEDGFIIDKKIGEGDWQLDYDQVGADVTTFVDDIFHPCANISYRVKTYADIGDTTFISAYSSTKSVYIRLNLSGSYNTPGSANEVFVLSPHTYERYALTADHYQGMQIIDCINPSQPIKVSNVALPDRTISVFALGNIAYATHRNGEVTLIDINQINNPGIMDTCITGGAHNDIEVSGTTPATRYAYVADGDIGLSIIIVSGPPHLITTQGVSGSAKSVSISGNYAYVSTGLNGGVSIINISNPSNPQVLSSLDFDGNALGLQADSSYVYLANGARGLEIIDISDPSSPQHIANCPTEGFTVDIKTKGEYAYAIDTEKGLVVFDISDKSNPFILAIKTLETEPTSIDISGSYAFITDNEGLKIYQINE